MTTPVAPDLLERLRARFHDHPVQQYLKFEILELELDRCRMAMAFGPHMDSGGGNIHGGVLASLADTAVACALSTNFDGKMGFATSNLNIHFLRRARTDLIADASIVKKGSKVCVGYVEIRDAERELVAVATTDYVLTTSRLPSPTA